MISSKIKFQNNVDFLKVLANWKKVRKILQIEHKTTFWIRSSVLSSFEDNKKSFKFCWEFFHRYSGKGLKGKKVTYVNIYIFNGSLYTTHNSPLHNEWVSRHFHYLALAVHVLHLIHSNDVTNLHHFQSKWVIVMKILHEENSSKCSRT